MLVRNPINRARGQQHDLGELMALYECNYIRLRQMIACLPAGDEPVVSRLDGALDLHLRVLERSRYTTTLLLTYWFEDGEGAFPAPEIRVRLYHDARLAEVLSCGRRRGRRDALYDRTRRPYSLDQKWSMNRFLQKWLGYCLRQGHRFGRRPDATPADCGWDELLASLGNA